MHKIKAALRVQFGAEKKLHWEVKEIAPKDNLRL
jgi:hypothetical protein